MNPKTTCPLTHEEFAAHATSEVLKSGEQILALSPQEFESGSFGYYAGGKITRMINGKPVQFQVSHSEVAVGSKDLAGTKAAQERVKARKAAKAAK